MIAASAGFPSSVVPYANHPDPEVPKSGYLNELLDVPYRVISLELRRTMGKLGESLVLPVQSKLIASLNPIWDNKGDKDKTQYIKA